MSASRELLISLRIPMYSHVAQSWNFLPRARWGEDTDILLLYHMVPERGLSRW